MAAAHHLLIIGPAYTHWMTSLEFLVTAKGAMIEGDWPRFAAEVDRATAESTSGKQALRDIDPPAWAANEHRSFVHAYSAYLQAGKDFRAAYRGYRTAESVSVEQTEHLQELWDAWMDSGAAVANSGTTLLASCVARLEGSGIEPPPWLEEFNANCERLFKNVGWD